MTIWPNGIRFLRITRTIIAFSLCILFITSLLACLGPSLPGIYVRMNGSDTLVLNPDGTYQFGILNSGKWTASGNRLTLVNPLLGAQDWTIEGIRLISPQGVIYNKR